MNYIFGNNTLYPRSSRVGGASGGQGAGLGLKQKLGPKRCSSEELAPPHTSSPSTSSPASSSPSTSSSRWQQLLTFFSRRSAFTDCITSSQGRGGAGTKDLLVTRKKRSQLRHRAALN
ncbi:hypothetical protein CHARACLAT_025901 [Characodon lateralis]|uniref:Uncharacterized protein n=1 Tax=Characodon lateralis TaxID=208331 RepID=A0ABU7DU86_9TELE|nr:hypothetical protein [Characodon lateralis]